MPKSKLRKTMKRKWEASLLSFEWVYKSSPILTIVVIVVSIFAGLLAIVPPYIFKLIIDGVSNQSVSGLYLAIGAVGLILLYSILGSVHNTIFILMSLIKRAQINRIRKYSMLSMMRKVSSLDVRHFEDPEYHNTIEKANENLTQILELFWMLTYLITALVAVFSIVGGLFTFNWLLVVVVLASAVPGVFVTLKNVRNSLNAYEGLALPKRYAKYYKRLLTEKREVLKESKIFKLKPYFEGKFSRLFDRIIKKYDSVYRTNLKWVLGSLIIESGLIAIAAWLIVKSFLDGGITIGDLTFFWALLFQFSGYLRDTVRIIGHLDETTSKIGYVAQVMKMKPTIRNVDKPKKFPKNMEEGIEFKNVSFKYPRAEKYSIRNLNLKIEPGENIALVGENGSGKTTMVKLLCRFYDVTEGEILIDGVNIKEYDLNSLYENIGVIFQDFMKYEGRIKENIGFGKSGKKEHVHESASKSGAWEFIRSFDKEYSTHLGRTIRKSGTELSGGQWQKIALARAFFKDSPILILDEPTAAVDAKAEYEMFSRFNKLTENKTSILISHRFSTVRMANKIVVMDRGRVRESGSHKDLIKKGGIYAKLFNLQAEGYK